MDYVKEDEILVYPGMLEAIETKTIFIVAMDIMSRKLANAMQKTVEEMLSTLKVDIKYIHRHSFAM